MDWNQISWNYARLVGINPVTQEPIFYKEGTCDSSVTLPTGTEAANLGDGSLIRHSDNGQVKTYNRKTDDWVLLLTLGS